MKHLIDGAARAALALALVCLAATLPAAAHNVYASFTDVFWNADDKSVEIVVEAHAHEIEAYLSVVLAKRLTYLEETDIPALEAATGPMILDNMAVEIDGAPVRLQYLGSRLEGQTLMLFMEADWPARPKKVTIMNSLLLDVLPGQVNSILLRIGDDRRGGDIRQGDTSLSFDF